MSKKKEGFDPGFGTRFKGRTKRVINKDGSFNVEKQGASFRLNDAYLFLLDLSWTKFLALLIAGYVAINLLFALLYTGLGEGAISGMNHQSGLDSFLAAYYFSTQTFTTVGYGALSPVSDAASLIASFEAFVGFLSFSLATGLLFGRFSKPRAKIRYSQRALISNVNGTRSLVFRIVNARPNQLMEMSATVLLSLTWNEQGSMRRSFSQLNLEINHIEFFPLNWTIVHPIDEESPLHGMSNTEIIQSAGELLIHVKGFDEMFSQELHSRYSYRLNEVEPNARFLPMFETSDDGEIVLDLDRLSAFETEEGEDQDLMR